jgi:curli biogenesis system outer membrane secretion channel CsgG
MKNIRNACMLFLFALIFSAGANSSPIEKVAAGIAGDLEKYLSTADLEKNSRIAVVRYDVFNARGNTGMDKELGETLSVMLSNKLTGVEVVERIQIDTLLKEQKLMSLGYVDESVMDEMRAIHSVNYIVTGIIVVSNKEIMAISFLTNVTNGLIVWAYLSRLPYESDVEYPLHEMHQFLWINALVKLTDATIDNKSNRDKLDKLKAEKIVVGEIDMQNSEKYFGLQDVFIDYLACRLVRDGFKVLMRMHFRQILNEKQAEGSGMLEEPETQMALYAPDVVIQGNISVKQDQDLYTDLNERQKVEIVAGATLSFTRIATGRKIDGVTGEVTNIF